MRSLAILVLAFLGSPQEREWRIKIGDGGFNPPVIQVNVGDTVVWMNVREEGHSVRGSGFDSGRIEPGVSWERVFLEPGDYDYACGAHPNETGRVVVPAPDRP